MKAPNIGIIIFARMSSSRLPGKMLRPLGPTTLLERVIERSRMLERDIILATSTDASDDVLEKKGQEMRIPVFRESLDDVLGRAVAAARSAGFDAFCRLCGDRPFMPLNDMRRGMEIMRCALVDDKPLDLVTTHLPKPVPAGLLTEVIRTESLACLDESAETAEQREHVTTMFYEAPKHYRIHPLESDLRQLGPVHLSVDTERDRDLIGRVIHEHPASDCDERVAAAAWTRLARAGSL